MDPGNYDKLETLVCSGISKKDMREKVDALKEQASNLNRYERRKQAASDRVFRKNIPSK